jgi:hypothetical protein
VPEIPVFPAAFRGFQTIVHDPISLGQTAMNFIEIRFRVTSEILAIYGLFPLMPLPLDPHARSLTAR